jgi:hypothetical protein
MPAPTLHAFAIAAYMVAAKMLPAPSLKAFYAIFSRMPSGYWHIRLRLFDAASCHMARFAACYYALRACCPRCH